MRKWKLAGLGLLLVLLSSACANSQSFVSGKNSYITRVDTLCTGRTIGQGDTLNLDLGPIYQYWELFIKITATSWATDSINVRLGTSENATWATGRTTYFDKNPATAAVDHWPLASYDAYGTCFPLVNAYGAYLPGPYGVLTIDNYNLADDDIEGLTIVLIKRK